MQRVDDGADRGPSIASGCVRPVKAKGTGTDPPIVLTDAEGRRFVSADEENVTAPEASPAPLVNQVVAEGGFEPPTKGL